MEADNLKLACLSRVGGPSWIVIASIIIGTSIECMSIKRLVRRLSDDHPRWIYGCSNKKSSSTPEDGMKRTWKVDRRLKTGHRASRTANQGSIVS
ncbi:hypothetical protein KC330_g125 [Hortaea werneckii]|nr:hypothetical protein KC330_g125 [Hortaea werneckii]